MWIIVSALIGCLIAWVLTHFLYYKRGEPITFKSTALIYVVLLLLAILLGLKIQPYYAAWEFEHKISDLGLFKAIALRNPQAYEQFMQKSKRAIHAVQSPEVIQAYSGELVNQTFSQFVSYTPDSALYDFLRAQVQFYEYLLSVDPRLLVQAELGRFSPKEKVFQDEAGKARLIALAEAKKAVIQLAEGQRVVSVSELEVAELLRPVLEKIKETYGEQYYAIYASGAYDRLPEKTAAQMLLAFYRALYQLGQRDASKVMRVMIGRG